MCEKDSLTRVCVYIIKGEKAKLLKDRGGEDLLCRTVLGKVDALVEHLGCQQFHAEGIEKGGHDDA